MIHGMRPCRLSDIENNFHVHCAFIYIQRNVLMRVLKQEIKKTVDKDFIDGETRRSPPGRTERNQLQESRIKRYKLHEIGCS